MTPTPVSSVFTSKTWSPDRCSFDLAGNPASPGLLGSFELQIEGVVDSEPPIAFIGGPLQPLTQGDQPYQFVVYTRDNQSSVFAGRTRVFSATGAAFIVTGIAGGFDEANDRNWEGFELRPPAGGWKVSDNGEYFIELPEDTLIDDAGNATPGQILGSFLIQIV